MSRSTAIASGVRSRGCANKRTRSNGKMAAADAAHCRSVRRSMTRDPIRVHYSEEMEWILGAWGRILTGYTPALSLEITRECPLRCPGCYAYGDQHLGGEVVLRQLADFQGQELIDRFLEVLRQHRPVHVSIVGGEPLVRFRELDVLLPTLVRSGIYTQLVTSAVRPIPQSWAG